jgi:murein DD-endopeptidase MepM/ murein hydrolase activator NlpD
VGEFVASRLPWLIGGGVVAAYVLSRHGRVPLAAIAPADVADATAPLPGRWVWPVPIWNGRKPVVSSGWGSVRDNGTRLHKGADIMFHRVAGDPFAVGSANGSKSYVMPDGLVAVAASDGIVWSARMTSRGFAVVVDHGAPSKVATFYQHLSSLLVTPTERARAEQRVMAGKPLGIIGGDPTDGTQKLKHLHFEIWRGGPSAAVDPMPLLRGWQVLSVRGEGVA